MSESVEMMADESSPRTFRPTLASAPTPETPIGLSGLSESIGAMAGAVGPVLAPPEPLSRGAVVEARSVTGSSADPLGGNTTRHLQLLANDAPTWLFTGAGASVDRAAFELAAAEDPHQYRWLVALPDAHRMNLHDFTRSFMERIEADTGRSLDWIGAIHDAGPGPAHAHLTVRGRDRDGQVLQLTQQYQLQGLRIRAQEVSTETLGQLSPLTQRGRDSATWLAMAASTRLERALEGPRQQVNLMVMRVQQWTRTIPSLTVGQAIHREEARVGRLQTFAREHATTLERATARPGLTIVPGQSSPSREAVLARLTPASQQLLQRHAQTVVGRDRPVQTMTRSGGLGR